jgi:pumilio RNA-binding family
MKDEANKSITENIRLMLKDQKGSKYFQKKIEEKSPEFLAKLYEKIKNHLFEIMTDQYGNYVIQKFLEYCDKKLISDMFSKLSNTLYEISINNYGTRPIQKMIENLSSNMSLQDINIILSMTKGNVLDLIKDINGNRVIQSIIQNIKNKELLSPLYKELNDNINEILKTKSGCCVFSKVIYNITENDLNLIVDNIIPNLANFINDEFGNISLKRIIKLNNENYNNKFFSCIKDNITQLSCQKFSSNVIEACIDNNTSLKKKTIDKLIENDSIISKLILDQFGNYIVQKALQNAEQKEFDIIIDIIKNNGKKLKQSQHGKVVYEKLMKSYKKYLVDDKSEKGEGKISSKNTKNKKHNNGNKNKNKFGGNKKK